MNKTTAGLIYAGANGYHVDEHGAAYGPRGPLKISARNRGRVSKYGYLDFTVNVPGVGRAKVPVHRFAAYLKFGDQLFAEGLEVRHLDGNRINNRPDNIALGTHSQNMMDRDPQVRLDHARLASQKLRRLSDIEQARLRRERAAGAEYRDLAEKYGVSVGTAHYIVNGKKKKAPMKDVGG